jgi:(1->4)-alpha-D-glucan 1-alpha-D-glucosylmutase
MGERLFSSSRIPRATYRLQFNEYFRLQDASALVPYLHELGISHVYASPLFKACAHSSHGYDVCDFSQLNPEIGTEIDLEKLVAALRAHDMGLVLDIVPNHMGICGPDNIWWWDVLKKGRSSRFADYFDIDWQPSNPDVRGKILVPVLGDEYERILMNHELQIGVESHALTLRYHDHLFPLSPDSETGLPREAVEIQKFNSDLERLDGLINQQHYRLACFLEGDRELNYRRFFAISSLAALRVEDEKVFNEVHALVRRWYERGWVDGLRVDHPDGLRDPERYLERLRLLAPNAWIVVEKILKPEEWLPNSWPVDGTTGYDFLNRAGGVFIDSKGEKALSELYGAFAGESASYPSVVYTKKRDILRTLLAAEIQRLAVLLGGLVAFEEGGGYFTRLHLAEALTEVIACFPVYRSYLAPDRGASNTTDVAHIEFAVHLGCEKRPELPPEIFAWIRGLLINPPANKTARDFVYRFQQLTGPAMAKGEEDTAFYCFHRLISLNEVGGDPAVFGVTKEVLQAFCQHLHQYWPGSLLSTSTHDTKRSEDVRARLALLSEIPGLWRQKVQGWSAMNERRRCGEWPDRNTEYLFYQTIVGAWPLARDRVLAFMEKAVREAKVHTNWTKPNQAYEAALRRFVSEACHDPDFIAEVEQFVAVLADAGQINSLGQMLIKLTTPGVPDIYQGCDLWNFALVDPDNRRPVDYQERHRILGQARTITAEEAWRQRKSGLPKLWTLRRVLNVRARRPDWFEGPVQMLEANGAKADHLVALMSGKHLISILPRFLLKLNNDWADTSLTLPRGIWHNEFTEEELSGTLNAETLFQRFPVALLTRKETK